jgi:hypothetical protein
MIKAISLACPKAFSEDKSVYFFAGTERQKGRKLALTRWRKMGISIKEALKISHSLGLGVEVTPTVYSNLEQKEQMREPTSTTLPLLFSSNG